MAAITMAEAVLIFFMYLMQNDEGGFDDSVKTINGTAILSQYDFIIIGGGSAGSVLANRLSEIKEWKILLLEAGEQENVYTKTPATYLELQKTKYDWNYTTMGGKSNTNGFDGALEYPRGRVLGGSSSINGMIYTRGYRWDYDRWGQDNVGWSSKDVEPYFLKLEGNRIPNLERRGRNGPIAVDYPPYTTLLRDQMIKAGVAKGLKESDCAHTQCDCIQKTQTTIGDGKRCSASAAYLESVSNSRENLHIVTNAIVTRIIIENKTATGAEFKYREKVINVKTTKEILLSAGTINSPTILMLSGIGIKKHLESLGIPAVADLPVGDNLQDHNRVSLLYTVQNGSVTNIDDYADEKSMEQYASNQTGPYSYTGVEVIAFGKRGHGTMEPPNVQHHFNTMFGQQQYLAGISTTVVRPYSRGTIRLISPDPTEDPLIDLNYYGDKRDWHLTHEGMQFANEIFETEPLTSFGASLFKAVTPKCADIADFSDYSNCVIKYYTTTMYHPVGSVKMAPKYRNGVVNSDLQVYGIRNLRVIDASIAPTAISMNTNAMSIMIGEKGSDIVKAAHGQM